MYHEFEQSVGKDSIHGASGTGDHWKYERECSIFFNPASKPLWSTLQWIRMMQVDSHRTCSPACTPMCISKIHLAQSNETKSSANMLCNNTCINQWGSNKWFTNFPQKTTCKLNPYESIQLPTPYLILNNSHTFPPPKTNNCPAKNNIPASFYPKNNNTSIYRLLLMNSNGSSQTLLHPLGWLHLRKYKHLRVSS